MSSCLEPRLPRVAPLPSITDPFFRPLNDLRISVTPLCNLHCHYCMTDTCSKLMGFKNYLSFSQITRLATISAGLGVSKIRITGGEPLLRPRLELLIEQLAAIPGITDMALTTNGVLLRPQLLTLKKAGLQRLTISLDSLIPERFPAKYRRKEQLRSARCA